MNELYCEFLKLYWDTLLVFNFERVKYIFPGILITLKFQEYNPCRIC